MARIASKATKGKGKRWQKGSSSTCNPEVKKHRSRVADALLGANSNVTSSNQSFKLTKDLLEKFDAIQTQKLRLQGDTGNIPVVEDPGNGGIDQWLTNQASRVHSLPLDREPETRSIAGSAASAWTNCTNISFDRFLNGFDAKSTMHKAMLTVLATVREAIEHQEGSETETEYFAGLMLALNCVDSEEKLTATISLIQIILPKVPGTVLKVKFVETAQTLLRILHERIESSNAYLVKAIIKTLAGLMQEQEAPAWETTTASKIFQLLLELILHPKPRIRKAAQYAVNSIINNKKAEPPLVARKLLAQFCITNLEKHLRTSQDQHLQSLLYISTLMAHTFHRFPSVEDTKRAAEAILSHMTFGNVLVINGALQTFYYFFMDRPGSAVLSPELNAQLLNALYDYQPNINDEQPLNAWLLAMSQGLLSLHVLDRKLCHAHVFKFVKTCVACFASDSRAVQATSASTVQQLFTEIVAGSEEFDNVKRQRFFEEVENGLKYQYANSWLRVIPMLAHLQLPVTSGGAKYLSSIWQRLAILHEPKESELNSAIDHVLGAAIKFYGPRAVLSQIPVTWQASETEMSMDTLEAEIRGEFSNAWLLPILRDSIAGNGEIGLFIEHFLPLAEELGRKAASCTKTAAKLRQKINDSMDVDDGSASGKDLLFKAHEAILVTSKELRRCVHASWALLPALCRSPIDVPQQFYKIAKKLGETLAEPEFRDYSSNALKNLLTSGNEEILGVLAKFAKNYLPILFNVFTSEPESTSGQQEDGHRGQILMIIQRFIVLLYHGEPQEALFRTFYEKIKERLNEQNCTDFRRKALLDLLNAFLTSPKGLGEADIRELYHNIALPLIKQGKIASDQKKGFKIIEQIFVSESLEAQEFVQKNLEESLKFLHGLLTGNESGNGSFISPSTTAFAMRTLKQLITKLTGSGDMFKSLFESFLPQIITALELRSSKAVKNAKELLLTIFDAAEERPEDAAELLATILRPLKRTSGMDDDDAQPEVAGKTGRVIALYYLYAERYHQKSASLQCDIADVILSQISRISTKTSGLEREVINVCFDFITLFLKTSKDDTVMPYLEDISSALTNLPNDQRTKFRMKIKVLLTKLGRKFGFDMISKLISEDYRKVLKNIRKLEAAKKRKKSANGEKDSDEENDDEDDDRKSKKSRKTARFMDSSDEDEAEVRDFMDDDWKGDDSDDEEDERQAAKNRKLDIMSRISTKTSKSFFREDANDDPIDLLSTSASKQIFSKIPRQFRPAGEDEKVEDDSPSALAKRLPVADDGRINLGQLLNQIEKTDKFSTTDKNRKRLRDDDDDDKDDDDDSDEEGNCDVRTTKTGQSYRPGGVGIHRPVSVSGRSVKSSKTVKTAKSFKSQASAKQRPAKKKFKGQPTVNKGDAYRSKKASGDMKRANMPDPYAYIPMTAVKGSKAFVKNKHKKQAK